MDRASAVADGMTVVVRPVNRNPCFRQVLRSSQESSLNELLDCPEQRRSGLAVFADDLKVILAGTDKGNRVDAPGPACPCIGP